MQKLNLRPSPRLLTIMLVASACGWSDEAQAPTAPSDPVASVARSCAAGCALVTNPDAFVLRAVHGDSADTPLLLVRFAVAPSDAATIVRLDTERPLRGSAGMQKLLVRGEREAMVTLAELAGGIDLGELVGIDPDGVEILRFHQLELATDQQARLVLVGPGAM